MSVLPRILLFVLLALSASQATADVVELSLRVWGTLIPLGTGASGHRLLDSATVKLDEHLDSVDVVHTEKRDVATTVDGRQETVKKVYYFVRVRVDKNGATASFSTREGTRTARETEAHTAVFSVGEKRTRAFG